MNLDEFAQQIQDMRVRMTHLQQYAVESPPLQQELEVMATTFEELSSSLEELQQQHEDMKERHRLESELQLANDRFQLVAKAVNGIIYDWDIEKQIIDRTQGLVEVLGYLPEEAEPTVNWWTERIHPDDRERISKEVSEALRNSNDFTCEYRVKNKDNQYLYIWDRGIIIRNATGKAVRVVGSTINITERKQALQQARESEERYRLLSEMTSDFAFSAKVTSNGEMSLEWITEAFFRIAGYNEAEVSSPHSWMKIVHPDDWLLYQQNGLALLAGQSIVSEIRIVTKSGDIRWVREYARPVWDEPEQRIVRILGAAQDITEQKLVEEALRESEQRFQTILDNSLTAIFVKDLQGKYLMVNRETERILHRNRDEIIGKTDRDFLEQAIAETLQVNDQEVIFTQTPIILEEVVPQLDGLHTYIAVKFPLFDSTGVPYAVCGISTDITERKAAEEALQRLNEQLEIRVKKRTTELENANEQLRMEIAERTYVETALSEREQEFRALVENAPDIIARYDRQLRHIYINPAIELATGLSPREFIGKTLQELDIPTQLASFWHSAIKTVFATNSEHEIEFDFLTPSGLKYYQSRLAPELVADGTTETVLVIIRDITKLKQAEEKILRSEERFRTSVENMLDCFGIYTSIREKSGKILDFRTEYVNAAACENDGKTKEELVGKGLCELLPAHRESGLFEEYCQVVETGEPLIKENLIYENVYGQIRLTRAYDIRIAKLGDGFAASWRDITERKQSETALQESEQLLRQLAENIHEVFWMFTPDTSLLIYVSPAYQEIWGCTCESLYEDPMSWMEAIHPQDRDRVAAAYMKQSSEDYDEDYRIVRTDGAIRWIRDRRFPVRDEQGRIYRLAGLAEDITERKQAQEELYKSLLKERELGELKSRFVSMTSHEFRTPLTTIQSSVELLEYYRHKLSQEKQITLMHRIQTAVERMTQMLDDILLIGEAESGKLEFNPAPLNLGQFCRDLLQELQLAYPNQQEITFSHQGECTLALPGTSEAWSSQLDNPPTKLNYLNQEGYEDSQNLALMDEKLLRHILSNLLSNAIKYSPNDSAIQFHLTCCEGNAIFQIQDQGIGIPPEDQERLFESFHRGTNVGTIQGTGLGLTIVKQCVDLHRGKITVSSIAGEGTTFTVTLPLNNWEKGNW